MIVITGAEAGLRLTTSPSSGLILSLSKMVLSPALDKGVYLGEGETASEFWRQHLIIAIINHVQQVEKCKCKCR